MDELTINDIVRGVVDESMKEERISLIELLANKVAVLPSPMTSEESKGVFIIALAKINDPIDGMLVQLFVSLLANATINEQNAISFMQFLKSSEKYNNLFRSAIEKFLQHNPQLEAEDISTAEEWSVVDPWENMAAILCNLCQAEEGRVMVLRQSSTYMTRIITQV